MQRAHRLRVRACSLLVRRRIAAGTAVDRRRAPRTEPIARSTMVPPEGVSQEYDATTPSTGTVTPMSTDTSHASLGTTGSRGSPSPPGTTMRALISSSPMIRIDMTMVDAVSTASARLSRVHREAGGPGELLVVGHREQRPGEPERHDQDDRREDREDGEVAERRRRDRAEEVGVQGGRRPSGGLADEYDAARDPAVEDEWRGRRRPRLDRSAARSRRRPRRARRRRGPRVRGTVL